MKLNEKIYEYRKQNRWSQEELAEKLEVSRQTISKWEVGKNVPELDKLIKISELFNITVDELVKDEIDIVYKNNIDKLIENDNKEEILKEEIGKNNENDLEKEKNKKRIFEIKKGTIKKVIIIVLILFIIVVVYKWISEKITLLKREKDIKEIAQVYEENFKTIGREESALISEVIKTKENNIIKETFREYYVYAEDGKNLIKIKDYEGGYRENLVKETYIDLSQSVSSNPITNVSKYNNVTEVYIDDWSIKVINDYEFINPIDRITMALEDRYYDLEGNAERIALEKENDIFSLKMPKHNTKSLGWTYGIKNNSDRKDFFEIYMYNDCNLFLYFDDYKNDIQDAREIIDISVSKVKGHIDDVTVPKM